MESCTQVETPHNVSDPVFDGDKVCKAHTKRGVYDEDEVRGSHPTF